MRNIMKVVCCVMFLSSTIVLADVQHDLTLVAKVWAKANYQ